jgi:hypothetical protein
LEKLKYAEIVIEEVHSKTIHGGLQWKDNKRSVSAQPIPAIDASIYYTDEGPDAAIWEYVLIGHPVGKDMTMIGNPASPKANLCQLKATGQMLDQVNEIFRQVLLDPRKTEFEAAIKQLHEA